MNNCVDSESQMCLDSFINDLSNDLTAYCQLPFSLPKKSLAQIIEQAKKYFYAHYEDAVEEMYIAVSKEAFKTTEFKKGYNDSAPTKVTKEDLKSTRGVVIMPDTVYSVNAVYEIGGYQGETGGWMSTSVWNTRDKDFAIGKFIYADTYDLGAGASGAADNLMCYVINEYWLDTARQVLQHKIGYNYNRLTHRFRFTGELPKGTCIFQVYVTIDDCDLYQDELFYRYCRAAAMQSMGRIIGTFTYNLPGGVTINADMYTQEGQDALDAIKEEIKELSAPDFFLTS